MRHYIIPNMSEMFSIHIPPQFEEWDERLTFQIETSWPISTDCLEIH